MVKMVLSDKELLASSFKYVWIVQIPFLVIALGAVCCLRSVKRDMNAIIDRPVEPIREFC